MTPTPTQHQQNSLEHSSVYRFDGLGFDGLGFGDLGCGGLFRLNGLLMGLMGIAFTGTAMMLSDASAVSAETLVQVLAQDKIQMPGPIKALPRQQSRVKPGTWIEPSPANMPVPAPTPGLGRNRPQQPSPSHSPGISTPSSPPGSIPARRPAPAPQNEQSESAVTPLRVPSLKVPVGNAGDRSDVQAITLAQMPWVSEPTTVALASDSPSTLAPRSYQIFVETPDPITQAQIQAHLQWLVPGAFPTLIQGRKVIQVGNFRDLLGSERRLADQLMQRLIQAGFWPRIHPLP